MATITRDIVHTKGTKHGQALSVESISSSPSRLASGVRLRHTGQPPSLFLSELETFKGRGPLRDSWSHTGDEVQVFELATSVLELDTGTGSGPRPSALSPGAGGKRFLRFYTPFRPWLLPVQEPGTCFETSILWISGRYS